MSNWKSLARTHWPLIAGFAMLIYVGTETVRVSNENASLRAALDRQGSTAMIPGDRIVDVAGIAVGGTYKNYSLNAQTGGLIIALSASCGYCQRNFDSWKRLSAIARESGVQVVWVSRDSYSDALETRLFDQDPSLIADATFATYNRLKLHSVPQTALVSGEGNVELVEVGVLNDTEETSISQAIRAVRYRAAQPGGEGRRDKRSPDE